VSGEIYHLVNAFEAAGFDCKTEPADPRNSVLFHLYQKSGGGQQELRVTVTPSSACSLLARESTIAVILGGGDVRTLGFGNRYLYGDDPLGGVDYLVRAESARSIVDKIRRQPV
jgi:hypothetical protein